MRRKFKNRQRRKSRLTLRNLLYAGTALCAGLLILSVFTVSFFRKEESAAGYNPMVVTGITVEQDTSGVYKGSTNVALLKVIVSVRGNGNRLSLLDIKFDLKGTTPPVASALNDLRLWYTAGRNSLSLDRQMGKTIATPHTDELVFDGRQLLQEGRNYFWLTGNTGVPAQSEVFVDAGLISATIGTLTHEPDIHSPAGKRKLLNNKPWFSNGNGDISSLKSWNSKRDGSGDHPENFNSSQATFHVQAGHVMQNELNACLPNIIIEKNGVLRSSSGINAGMLMVESGGMYVQTKPISGVPRLNELKVKDGGNYIHANSGPIAARMVKFYGHSNTVFNAYPSVWAHAGTPLGNVSIDLQTQETGNWSTVLQHIRGDLEIRNTGIEGTMFIGSENEMKVEGNLILLQGTVALKNEAGNSVISIGNELVIRNGKLYDTPANKGVISINAGKGIVIRGGITELDNKTTTVQIIHPNTGWYQSEQGCIISNLVIRPGASLEVRSAELGTVSNTIHVMNNAALDCGSGIITGNGEFILDEGATLITAHKDGISESENAGCLRFPDRILHSGANYIFNGADQVQKTGNFVTKPAREHVRKLVIEKEHISQVVVLERDFIYMERSEIKTGSINKNGFRLEWAEQDVAQIRHETQKSFHSQ